MSVSPLHEDAETGLWLPQQFRPGGARGFQKRVTSSFADASSTSAAGQIFGLFSSYAPLGYQLPWGTLDYVELLSTYNPDFSQAVENIKMIANSGHSLFVDASSGLKQRRVKALLEDKAKNLQSPHGGIDGIVDKLLDQGATYGAMSGEIILSDDLREVVDFVDLNPKKIRFFWDEELQRFRPFQKVNGNQLKEAEARGQEIRNGCVALNEVTFKYFAFDAAPESPYGTPPFLAALANIAIQRDMIGNMAQIVKKIGLLGMVDLTVKALAPAPGETEAAYKARATTYINEYVDAAEAMAREGGLVHFDDAEVKTMNLAGNAAGATNIHKANEELIFSGLKSMPSVQGRSFSTTETYAGVAYEIVLRNTKKYQRACKRFIESIYWTIIQLSGEEQPDLIRLEFNENRSLNRLQEANAQKSEIQNAFFLWVLGILDQTGVAQRLGYSEPKTPLAEPPAAIVGSLTAHDVEPPDVSPVVPPVRGSLDDHDDEEEDEEAQGG